MNKPDDHSEDSIGLGIICPTEFLPNFATKSWYHLVLTHKVLSDKAYYEFYKERSEQGDYITLDNSSYEVGDDVFTNADLLHAAKLCGAHEIMAPEQYQDASITLDKVLNFTDWMRNQVTQIKIFATIHGTCMADYKFLFRTYIQYGINTIGISCRLDPGDGGFQHPNKAYQKSVVRAKIVKELYPFWFNSVRPDIHLLGMNHPAELTFYNGNKYGYMVRSCDSSAAFINGYLNRSVDQFDYVKPDMKMDFDIPNLTILQYGDIINNIDTLKRWAQR